MYQPEKIKIVRIRRGCIRLARSSLCIKPKPPIAATDQKHFSEQTGSSTDGEELLEG